MNRIDADMITAVIASSAMFGFLISVLCGSGLMVFASLHVLFIAPLIGSIIEIIEFAAERATDKNQR